MVYFKGANDKHHRPMNIASGELFDRLAFAPIYRDELLPDVIRGSNTTKNARRSAPYSAEHRERQKSFMREV